MTWIHRLFEKLSLLCYTAVARLGFKCLATAMPNSIHE